MLDKSPVSKVIARLEYEQKFNLGKYQMETIKIVIEGPFEDIRDGKDLPRLLLYTATNMKKLTQKVHDGVDPRKYENLPDGVEAKVEDVEGINEGEEPEVKPPVAPVKPPEVKKEQPKEPPKEPKKELKKSEPLPLPDGDEDI